MATPRDHDLAGRGSTSARVLDRSRPDHAVARPRAVVVDARVSELDDPRIGVGVGDGRAAGDRLLVALALVRCWGPALPAAMAKPRRGRVKPGFPSRIPPPRCGSRRLSP